MSTTSIKFQPLLAWLKEQRDFRSWSQDLPLQLARGLALERWGDLPAWQSALAALPNLHPGHLEFRERVEIGNEDDCSESGRQSLRQTLMQLHPWRKGPLHLLGLHIDTEWRSDWKWNRVQPHLAPLQDRLVLDVGCGNGYYCLRMFGAGARRVIGIDPSAKFVHQFYALKHFCPHLPVDVLPLGIEQLPARLHGFDTVFSMGVLYHRKDPRTHLDELCGLLKPGGQLVLETLILDSPGDELLVPELRYAKMRNVSGIPSPTRVLHWLSACGCSNARLVDCTHTTTSEQRRTDWMRFESLADFLHPDQPELTVEGYPAPVRGVFVAEFTAPSGS